MRFFRSAKQRKMDLGTMDFPQTGWWLWHTAAIAGIYALGSRITKNRNLD